MTKLIEWSYELSVGIEEIDEQHKVLISIINEMHDAIQDKRGSQVVAKILDRLTEYTRIHFTVEESIMRILGYPDYEIHKKQHEELLETIQEMKEKVYYQKININFGLMNFLKLWLTEHIMHTDKQYTNHLLKQGAKAKWCKRFWIDRLW